MPLPVYLPPANEGTTYDYQIETYTGLRRGSGTKSRVYINLIGSKCSSGNIILEDGVRKVLYIYMVNIYTRVLSTYLKFSELMSLHRMFHIQYLYTMNCRTCVFWHGCACKFQNFDTGDMNKFSVSLKEHLGQLMYVHILHDNSGTGLSASWFLEKVIVRDHKAGRP